MCVCSVYIYIYIYLLSEVKLHEGTCWDSFSSPAWNTSHLSMLPNTTSAEQTRKWAPQQRATTGLHLPFKTSHDVWMQQTQQTQRISNWSNILDQPTDPTTWFLHLFMAGLVGPKVGTCQGAGLASKIPTAARQEIRLGPFFQRHFGQISVFCGFCGIYLHL